MSVLEHPKTGNPKDVTQQDSTHPQKTCLGGICKDMMSKMDPMIALGMQDEVAGTSVATRKFSSSIFCWKGLHKLQDGESRKPNASHSFRMLVLLAKASLPPFIATRDLTGGQPVMLQW
jgi:hypothetical protein